MGPNKAIAAGSAGGLSGALVTVALALWGHAMSPEVAAALTTIVSAALSAAAAWITPHGGEPA